MVVVVTLFFVICCRCALYPNECPEDSSGGERYCFYGESTVCP